jgi:hypothetical protein
MRYSSADVGFLLIDGYSVLGQQTQLDDKISAMEEDTTVLGVAWEEHSYIGVKAYELSQQGFYNDEANGNNAALINPGDSKVLSFAPRGNTVGKLFVGSPGIQVDYARKLSRGALHKADASYKSEGQHDEGIILHALGAETDASGDTEGVGSGAQDNGASSAAGGVGYLQVSALTLGGYDDVTITIRDSADDMTYAELIAFNDVAVAPAAERATVAGTVNRYVAHSWAFNGAGAAQTVTYAVGFARN